MRLPRPRAADAPGRGATRQSGGEATEIGRRLGHETDQRGESVGRDNVRAQKSPPMRAFPVARPRLEPGTPRFSEVARSDLFRVKNPANRDVPLEWATSAISPQFAVVSRLNWP